MAPVNSPGLQKNPGAARIAFTGMPKPNIIQGKMD